MHVLSVAQLVHTHACLWLSGCLQELKHVLGGNTLKLFCLIDSDDNGYIERSDWVGWFVQLKATCGEGECPNLTEVVSSSFLNDASRSVVYPLAGSRGVNSRRSHAVTTNAATHRVARMISLSAIL